MVFDISKVTGIGEYSEKAGKERGHESAKERKDADGVCGLEAEARFL